MFLKERPGLTILPVMRENILSGRGVSDLGVPVGNWCGTD